MDTLTKKGSTMAAPKKTNSSLSKSIASKPKPPVQKATLTTAQKANVAKANLLKQKGRVNEAKTLIKIGRELSAPSLKVKSGPAAKMNQIMLDDERGMSAQRRGAYGARKAAQPYGEAVRTNRRAQAQAKKKSK